jgi:hypothetical protein
MTKLFYYAPPSPNTEEYGEDVHAEIEAAGEQLAVASRAFSEPQSESLASEGLRSHLHADFVEGTLALPLIEVVAGR